MPNSLGHILKVYYLRRHERVSVATSGAQTRFINYGLILKLISCKNLPMKQIMKKRTIGLSKTLAMAKRGVVFLRKILRKNVMKPTEVV